MDTILHHAPQFLHESLLEQEVFAPSMSNRYYSRIRWRYRKVDAEAERILSSPTEETKRLRKPRIVEGMLCAACGEKTLVAMPVFSVGSGTVQRAIANDVLCQRCGHIAPPHFKKR